MSSTPLQLFDPRRNFHIGESVRPAIWPTPIMNECDDLAFDILAVGPRDPGSDLTVVIQT